MSGADTTPQEVDWEGIDSLPPYFSLAPFFRGINPFELFTQTWVFETLRYALRNQELKNPRVLSLGTGANGFDEYNALLHVTDGKVREYQGIDNNQGAIANEKQVFARIPSARVDWGDLKTLDQHVKGKFDVVIIRNPEMRFHHPEQRYNWGVGTRTLKKFLTDSSIVVATAMEHQDYVGLCNVLDGNKYIKGRPEMNPHAGPIVATNGLEGEIRPDKYLVKARR